MITVPKIQMALYNEFIKSSKLMVPNIFLWNPFESDFVRLTKSDYLIEYEIKLTKSDFKADFKKYKETPDGYETVIGTYHRPYTKLKYKQVTKHNWLLEGKGATEFYYVFPEGLINHDLVPKDFGIFEVHENSKYRCSVHKVRASKRLHKVKVSEYQINEINKSLYYRYWSELSRRNSNQILML